MLDRIASAPTVQPVSRTLAKEAGQGLDLVYLIGFAQRQWPIVAGVLIVALGLAMAFLLVAPAYYVGKAHLLLDLRKFQVFQQGALLSEVSFDAPAVESQMEILKSESIARSVVEDLKLTEDPEFTGRAHGFFGSISSAILRLFSGGLSGGLSGGPSGQADAELTRAAVAYLRSNAQISRLRSTYVIEVGFGSRDPAKAARIANAVAEAYILDQTKSTNHTTKRALTSSPP